MSSLTELLDSIHLTSGHSREHWSSDLHRQAIVSHVLVDGKEGLLGEGIQVKGGGQDELQQIKDSHIKISDERRVEDGIVQEMETAITQQETHQGHHLHPTRGDTDGCQDRCGRQDRKQKPHLVSTAQHTNQSEAREEGKRPCDKKCQLEWEASGMGGGNGSCGVGWSRPRGRFVERVEHGYDCKESEEQANGMERVESE
jgi:hypothetical protein